MLDAERMAAVQLSTSTASLADVDAVLLLTAHRAFDLELVAREAPLVLDTRAAVPAGDRVFRL